MPLASSRNRWRRTLLDWNELSLLLLRLTAAGEPLHTLHGSCTRRKDACARADARPPAAGLRALSLCTQSLALTELRRSAAIHTRWPYVRCASASDSAGQPVDWRAPKRALVLAQRIYIAGPSARVGDAWRCVSLPDTTATQAGVDQPTAGVGRPTRGWIKPPDCWLNPPRGRGSKPRGDWFNQPGRGWFDPAVDALT